MNNKEYKNKLKELNLELLLTPRNVYSYFITQNDHLDKLGSDQNFTINKNLETILKEDKLTYIKYLTNLKYEKSKKYNKFSKISKKDKEEDRLFYKNYIYSQSHIYKQCNYDIECLIGNYSFIFGDRLEELEETILNLNEVGLKTMYMFYTYDKFDKNEPIYKKYMDIISKESGSFSTLSNLLKKRIPEFENLNNLDHLKTEEDIEKAIHDYGKYLNTNNNLGGERFENFEKLLILKSSTTGINFYQRHVYSNLAVIVQRYFEKLNKDEKFKINKKLLRILNKYNYQQLLRSLHSDIKIIEIFHQDQISDFINMFRNLNSKIDKRNKEIFISFLKISKASTETLRKDEKWFLKTPELRTWFVKYLKTLKND